MKKTYNKPAIEVTEVQSVQVIAASTVTLSNETYSESDFDLLSPESRSFD